MATKIWTSGDGNWGVAGSWAASGVPATDDKVIFPNNNTQAVTTGHDTQNAIDLDQLIVHPGFAQNFGTSGTRLNISADKVIHEGTGTMFYKDGDGITDLFLVNSLAAGVAANISGSSVSRIVVIRGSVVLDSALGAVTNLEVSFFGSIATDATVEIELGAGTITNLIQNGGRVVCRAAVTNLYIRAGTFTQHAAATSGVTNIYGMGGNIIYNADSTITLAHILGGVLDCGQNHREMTITTLRVHAGAKAIIPIDRVTVTNAPISGQLLDRVTTGSPV